MTGTVEMMWGRFTFSKVKACVNKGMKEGDPWVQTEHYSKEVDLPYFQFKLVFS